MPPRRLGTYSHNAEERKARALVQTRWKGRIVDSGSPAPVGDVYSNLLPSPFASACARSSVNAKWRKVPVGEPERAVSALKICHTPKRQRPYVPEKKSGIRAFLHYVTLLVQRPCARRGKKGTGEERSEHMYRIELITSPSTTRGGGNESERWRRRKGLGLSG